MAGNIRGGNFLDKVFRGELTMEEFDGLEFSWWELYGGVFLESVRFIWWSFNQPNFLIQFTHNAQHDGKDFVEQTNIFFIYVNIWWYMTGEQIILLSRMFDWCRFSFCRIGLVELSVLLSYAIFDHQLYF